jgi:hypothetical protein
MIFGIFQSLFLYVVEIGQVAFIVVIIVFSIAIVIKIQKNRKSKNSP